MNLLCRLVRERRWTYESFCLHYERAARETAELQRDPRIATLTVSQRTFSRWTAGELRGLPSAEACLVLEHLLGHKADELFGLTAPTDAAPRDELVVPRHEQLTANPAVPRFVDPTLVPHWTGMLQILAAAHNAFGPSTIHQSAVHEMSVIRRFRENADSHLAVALLAVEARWAEFASWTADNLSNRTETAFWLDQALLLAQNTEDATLVSYVRMRQAQQAVERREVGQALSLAGQAWESAGDSTRDRALCAVRQAQAHALAHDSRASRLAIAEAGRLVELAEDFGADDDPSTIGRHCVPAYVQAHEASCQILLGDYTGAVRTLEQVLAGWPPDFRQDELLARVWLAISYLKTGQVAEAGALAGQVLAANATVGSGRVHRGLRQLSAMAAKFDRRPAEMAAFQASLALIPPRM